VFFHNRASIGSIEATTLSADERGVRTRHVSGWTILGTRGPATQAKTQTNARQVRAHQSIAV
jgi:hypothetical protein